MKIRQVAPDISGIRADHVARYQFVVDKILELKIKGDILDVGCGVGYGSDLMATECLTGVEGIDISEEAINYAKMHYSQIGTLYELMDMCEVDTGLFNIITMVEVIEHSKYAPEFLALASRHSKYLFGSVPNELLVPYKPDKFNTEHYRHYTPGEIVLELHHAGWDVTFIGGQAGKKGDKAKIIENLMLSRTIVFMAVSRNA